MKLLYWKFKVTVFAIIIFLLSGCVTREPDIVLVKEPCVKLTPIVPPKPVKVAVDPAYVDTYVSYIKAFRDVIRLQNLKIDEFNKRCDDVK